MKKALLAAAIIAISTSAQAGIFDIFTIKTIEPRETYTPNWSRMKVEHNELMAQKLKKVKAQGITCAMREDDKGWDYIMCKDEIGSFRLK